MLSLAETPTTQQMLDQKMIAQIGAACEHVSRNALKVLGALLNSATLPIQFFRALQLLQAL